MDMNGHRTTTAAHLKHCAALLALPDAQRQVVGGGRSAAISHAGQGAPKALWHTEPAFASRVKRMRVADETLCMQSMEGCGGQSGRQA
jgi:hypothetical protein